jgi:D-hydroxyproline dehydrogenase subunit beta
MNEVMLPSCPRGEPVLSDTLPASADVVVIGAGMVGAATAAALAATGRRVLVVDRAGPLGGTTAAGEGNILVSDKLPGPELALALHSVALWRGFAAEVAETDGVSGVFGIPEAGGLSGGGGFFGGGLPGVGELSGDGGFEFEAKGGVVAAHDEAQLAALLELAKRQRAAGVEVTALDPDGLGEAEPRIAPGLAGGAFYPQDSQVQPMQAALAFLRRARRGGAFVAGGADVLALERGPGGAVAGLVTSRGRVAAPVVVNAAGPWSGEVAARLGTSVPVRPRRGRILVTEPVPAVIRHKVYEADYVGAVESDSAALQCSAVVEGTASGTVLVGSSRDVAGFSAAPDPAALAEMARRAVRLFPFLARVRAIRSYTGFRPASPDHLPVIGADAAVPGLFHATGHEGAGIGLAPATAELITALVTETAPPVDPAPFAPARFPGPASTVAAMPDAR